MEEKLVRVAEPAQPSTVAEEVGREPVVEEAPPEPARVEPPRAEVEDGLIDLRDDVDVEMNVDDVGDRDGEQDPVSEQLAGSEQACR